MDIRNRAFVSVALVVVGITVAVIAGIIPSSEGGVQAQGIVLDYGDFDTEWAEADVESYETSDGNKCPSFLLVPTVVTKDNMKEELVDTGYYTQDDDGYLHPAG